MRRYVSLFVILTVGFAVTKCDKIRNRPGHKYTYPQDQKLSNPNGDPIDSLTYFLPKELDYGDSTMETKLDSFKLNWYSSQLYPSKEKILYNYYQGQSIYRFTWLRAFNEPVFIALYKKSGRVWLTLKKLDRQPDFMKIVYVDKPFPFRTDKSKTFKNSKMRQDSVVEPDRHANILINDTKELTMADWNNFEKLLADCHYWNMTPCEIGLTGFDGSQWIIEASSKDKYWVVDRWSPQDGFRECGVYLIKLSGLKEEIY